MYFNKLYSESGFIRDLAFKKLFLETPEFFTFVYEYSLQLLGLPFDDTIDLLDNKTYLLLLETIENCLKNPTVDNSNTDKK